MFEENLEKMIYTMTHREALKATIERYCTGEEREELLKRAKYHDMDKMVLLTMTNAKFASNIHRSYIRHHIEAGYKNLNKIDYLEMIMDWECARYTKPDKPRNAYDTMKDFYMEIEDKITPLLKELNLNYSNDGLVLDDEIYNKVKNYKIDKDEIKKQIEEYINGYDKYEKYDVLNIAIKTYKKLNK